MKKVRANLRKLVKFAYPQLSTAERKKVLESLEIIGMTMVINTLLKK